MRKKNYQNELELILPSNSQNLQIIDNKKHNVVYINIFFMTINKLFEDARSSGLTKTYNNFLKLLIIILCYYLIIYFLV